MEFPEKVMRQAESVPQEVQSELTWQGGWICGTVQMVTIDGEDAKDLDDAVSLTVDENGVSRWACTLRMWPTMCRRTVHWIGRH